MKISYIFSFILLSIITDILFAQTETPTQAKARIRHIIWNSGDDDFKTNQPLEKWKNEPAVYLCKKYEYSLNKEILASNINENIYSHNRILLLDKSAVEKYSTFQFDITKNIGSYFGYGTRRNVYLGLKVIKPDGTEKIVPIDETQTDRITGSKDYKETQKVAVPNLEPGDILDYYIVTESTVMGNYLYYGFSPVLYTMADEYPIQKQKIIMHIMRKCYLSSKSVNGAPEFKILNKQNPRDITWTIVDSDREKLKTQDFSYPLREVPYLIFQTYFAKNLYFNNVHFFVEKEDKFKNQISNTDWLTYVKSVKNDRYYAYLSQKIIKYLGKYCKNEKNPEVLAKNAYYFLREYIYGIYYQNNIANNEFSKGQINDYIFTIVLSRALRGKNIPHSIVITAPRELCTINDIIIKQQMGYLLKIETSNPFFLSSFDLYSTASIIDNSYQGNTAKNYKVSKTLDSDFLLNEIKIPVDSSLANKEIQELNVQIDPDSADKLNITQKFITTGSQKLFYQQEYISLAERVKEFEKNQFKQKYIKIKKPAHLLAFKNNLLTDSTNRHKRVQDYLKFLYGTEQISLKSCKTLQPGIWDEEPEFIFQNQFTISDFITQTGNDIMVNIGELAGIQSTYDKTDTIRKADIYYPFPRVWNLNISINIPEGYKIKGIENLNSHIDNNSGSFITKAELKGNKLEVLVHKEYKANFLPKSEWPFFKEFLDAANDFRNHKIILTRNN